MLEVRFMMFCEKCTGEMIGGRQATVVINPYITITPSFLPSHFTFYIVAGMDGLHKEERYNLRLRIFAPNEGLIHEQPLNFDLSSAVARKDGIVNVVGIIELMNFPFSEEGYYVAQLILDEKVIGETKLYVAAKE